MGRSNGIICERSVTTDNIFVSYVDILGQLLICNVPDISFINEVFYFYIYNMDFSEHDLQCLCTCVENY